MTLDPRHIRILLAITQHGSFSAASRALNTSQPALSNRIALLERELGAKVFDRGRHGVALTEVGHLLLRHARALDAVLLQAQAEIELKKRGKAGPLVVGLTPVAAIELVPRSLAELPTSQIAVSTIEDLDEVLLERLGAGELDLIVGSIGMRMANFPVVEERLLELSFAVVVGAKHKLARRRAIWLRDLADEQWALPPPGGAYRRYVEAIFLNNGISFPVDCWTANTWVSLKAIVQHTNCVALIPKHTLRLEEQADVLRAIRLGDPSPARPIGIIHATSRPLSPVAEHFREALRKVAKTIR